MAVLKRDLVSCVPSLKWKNGPTVDPRWEIKAKHAETGQRTEPVLPKKHQHIHPVGHISRFLDEPSTSLDSGGVHE